MGKLHCPHCTGEMTDKQIRTLWAKRNAQRRVTRSAGPGRPPKLSAAQRTMIATRSKLGETEAALAEEYHVSTSLIHKVVVGIHLAKVTIRRKPPAQQWLREDDEERYG